MTSDKDVWRKGTVSILRLKDCGKYPREGEPSEWKYIQGYLWGEVGVCQDPDASYPWRLVHLPSGKPFGEVRTLRHARQILKETEESVGLGFLGGFATGNPTEKDSQDYLTYKQIYKRLRDQ